MYRFITVLLRASGLSCYTSHRHKPELFDGRLDDNNMKDATTEMIPFASLASLAPSRLNRERERHKDARARKKTLFNFFRVDWILAKKINHRGRGGHRALLFSLCPLCALWFSEPIPGDNKKSRKERKSPFMPCARVYVVNMLCETRVQIFRR